MKNCLDCGIPLYPGHSSNKCPSCLNKTAPRKLVNVSNREIETTKQENEIHPTVKVDTLDVIKHVWNAISVKRRIIWVVSLVGLLVFTSGNYLLINQIARQSSQKNNSNSNSQKSNSPPAPAGMVYIPGGTFLMGNSSSQNEAERPSYTVTLKPFFMDIYETTNEQYAQFVKATGYKTPPSWRNGNYPRGQEKFPVVGVNWEDAMSYAKWAGKRLPTEEEWEFAARGPGNAIYPWGALWVQGKANTYGESKTVVEVGRYKGASPFGVFDMVGNAWEWTLSDFRPYPNGKLPQIFQGKRNLKTIRGGDFQSTREFATSTYRIGWPATGAENYDSTGFRCVKDYQ